MKKWLFSFILLTNGFILTAQTCPPSDITLSTQSQVDAFASTYPGCAHIPVNVIISSTNLIGAIHSLSGLSQITSIDGNLTITSNVSLASLSGLNNLTTVTGNLAVTSNTALLNVSGLNNLASVGGSVNFSSNTLLANISALMSLNSINGELRIVSNPLLLNLNGLDNINYQTISNLVIQSSVALVSCGVSSICFYLGTPGNSFTISANAIGCSTIAEIITSCGGALPVELTDFAGIAEDGMAFLSWKTISETDNAGFEVERANDLFVWETLSFIPGKGTTFELNTYQFTDEHPRTGVNYYRLKQIDLNGKANYSTVISIFIDRDGAPLLFPNPTSGKVYLTSNPDTPVAVTDYQGRLLKTVNGSEIDLSGFPQGVYFIAVPDGGLMASYKVLKQ